MMMMVLCLLALSVHAHLREDANMAMQRHVIRSSHIVQRAQDVEAARDSLHGNLMSHKRTRVVSSRKEYPAAIVFLRIQKTGGTTFGEKILDKQCKKHGQTCAGVYHLDYISASSFRDIHPNAKIVTLLRDPVERFMSEFSFLLMGDAHGAYDNYLKQDQWDMLNVKDDVGVIMKSNKSFEEKAHAYLHLPGSASRNRQTLYLLGFDRQGCPGNPWAGYCNGHSENGQMKGAVPGRMYNWDADGSVLAQRAIRNLDTIEYGLTDCYLDSLREFSEDLGWNCGTCGAEHFHKRQSQEHHGSWRSMISAGLIDEIENVNSADVEVFREASKRFVKRRPACQINLKGFEKKEDPVKLFGHSVLLQEEVYAVDVDEELKDRVSRMVTEHGGRRPT
jgi:hypothetical protein